MFEFAERCSAASVQLWNGKVVRISDAKDCPTVIAGIQQWLYYTAMEEAAEEIAEGNTEFQPRKFKLWAEVLPGGGARIHAKPIA
jgi:hypothetical protein